jgi:PBSX family phage terminase large subunit
MANKKPKLNKEQAIEELWRNSILSWKLKGKQKDIYNHFKNTDDDISACLISRQFGKSFTLCLIAIETCLEKPGAIVKYACPTQKMVERVIKPRIKEIISDCPEDLKPEWKTQDKVWLFPNGSEIQVAGTDNGNYDNLRGGSADLCIADESGFMEELETIIYSVLAPTTDTTGGRIFLASTPNDKDPNHEFHEFFVHPLEAAGKLLKFTYHDSPMVDEKKKEKIISRYPGGENNIKFRCEYLCEIPNVSDANVVPEFALVEEEVVKDIDKPDYCDFYTGADVGFHDLTVVLFGYYDYNRLALVITDEYVINGPELTTDKLFSEILHKEKVNFVTKRTTDHEPYLRIMDNDLKLINDLSRFYGLTFVPTEKHNKDQAVDTVRRWVEDKRIIISPKCKNLIYHLKYTQWHYTRQGTFTGKFKHLKGNQDAGLLKSHGDALDALIYMVRNIQTTKNPFPHNYGLNINKDTFISPKWQSKNNTQGSEIMKKMLNLVKKDKYDL